MSASLSTHVLDTGAGRPAAGVHVELYLGDELVGAGVTNLDGRIPSLADALAAGEYRIVFAPPSAFFARVALGVRLEEGHYHVPLLIAPYSCASYRGS